MIILKCQTVNSIKIPYIFSFHSKRPSSLIESQIIAYDYWLLFLEKGETINENQKNSENHNAKRKESNAPLFMH